MGAVSTRISVGQRGCASGTRATKGTTNSLWLAGKSVSALLATAQVATLVFELIHSDGRELGSSVVLSLVLVDLMNRDGGVDDGWLDRLLLYDGLDVLMHMVVDVLACDSGLSSLGVLNVADGAGVFELGLLGGETVLNVVVIPMLDVAVLDAGHVVCVLLGKDLLVLDGLNGGVVVVLVDFTVNGCLEVLVLGASDVLLGD
jgi:hypothetical protein